MLLEGKRGLVLNVTNKNSIGWAVAEAAREHGATVGVGAQNERMMDSVLKLIGEEERYVPFQIDFGVDGDYERLREQVVERFGTVDFVVHSAAYAPREALEGRFIDTKREDFALALDVSAYSLVKLCHALEPVLAENASIMAMSYLGSTRTVGTYNVMGVAKAALESATRYLANDLGPQKVRVNAISPGPMKTLAGAAIGGARATFRHTEDNAPLRANATLEAIGGTAVWLCSDYGACTTGEVIHVDGGYHVLGFPQAENL